MSAKNDFVLKEVASHLRPTFDILALGTDTRPGLAWSRKGRIWTLAPKIEPTDLGFFYRQACSCLARQKNFSPRVIAFDPHPYFECNRQASSLAGSFFSKAKLQPVFHHVAHAALFAHEAGRGKKFIALTWDGTGFGADGKVWGGEFLVYDGKSFRRVAHFATRPLPGNEKAILEPWRFAFSVLYPLYGERLHALKLDFLKGRDRSSLKILAQMMGKRLNSPQTSSVGRIFDGVAAMLGEASPMALETRAKSSGTRESYPFEITKDRGLFVIKTDELFRLMIEDIRERVLYQDIALKFHRSLAEIAVVSGLLLRKKYGISRVYCSGGVFMNDVLRREFARVFSEEAFDLSFAPKALTTDSGIALGQVAACVLGELKG